MAYVITDGDFYAFIDIRKDVILNGRLYKDFYKRYKGLSEVYKTKFLAKARPYKTKKEAEKDLKFAKIILRHSTLKIKKVFKKDLKDMKVFVGWNLITKDKFNFGEDSDKYTFPS